MLKETTLSIRKYGYEKDKTSFKSIRNFLASYFNFLNEARCFFS